MPLTPMRSAAAEEGPCGPSIVTAALVGKSQSMPAPYLRSHAAALLASVNELVEPMPGKTGPEREIALRPPRWGGAT